MPTHHQKNIAFFIHLSTFSRFLIPFGNIIGPLVLWITNKDKSSFLDSNGKEALNFQLSILLYSIIIGAFTAPFFLFNIFNMGDAFSFKGFHISWQHFSPFVYITGIMGFFALIACVIEFYYIIKASKMAKQGVTYHYPVTINFIK
ncbi:MAG: hypothetical protein BM564_05670 [Bacteroidetes bacterium MedPE-SWsnd-G2]|nr:MAG: hypothetical protein BM564_05670 [Bacteroidetes bacterium MedPE-SWsnd-G2]